MQTLVRRYLRAFAPATPEDCAAWSGLRISEIRAAWTALEKDLIELDTPNHPRFILKEQRHWLDEPLPKRPHVRLLAAFDTLLMGYVATRGARDLTLDPRYASAVLPGGGMLRPTLSVDGHLVATWRPERTNNKLHITLTPFQPLPKNILHAAELDAQDIARFVGTPFGQLEV